MNFSNICGFWWWYFCLRHFLLVAVKNLFLTPQRKKRNFKSAQIMWRSARQVVDMQEVRSLEPCTALLNDKMSCESCGKKNFTAQNQKSYKNSLISTHLPLKDTGAVRWKIFHPSDSSQFLHYFDRSHHLSENKAGNFVNRTKIFLNEICFKFFSFKEPQKIADL